MEKNNATNNANVEFAVQQSLKLPLSTQYALLKVVPNFSNGAFWGFDDRENALEVVEELQKDANVHVHTLADKSKVLVEVNPNYLMTSVAKTAPKLVRKEDLELMNKSMQEAYIDFDKFCEKRAKAKWSGIVGIYCVNDTTTMRSNGVSVPSFRVNLSTCAQILEKHGYAVVFNRKKYSMAEFRALGAAAYSMLGYSPTNTGLTIEIALL